jgi:hypothetical protein
MGSIVFVSIHLTGRDLEFVLAHLGTLRAPAMNRPDLHIPTTDIECKVAGLAPRGECHP